MNNTFVLIGLLLAFATSSVFAEEYLVFDPPAELANGKRIVLISGDEEYRSEETCPMLGKLLSQRFGFQCTVLFAIDSEGRFINPNDTTNIPGTDHLNDADLMIIGTRFRDLPESQLKPILDYLNAGKPIIGFRTATHAFNCDHKYGDFVWSDFGKLVIGDNWVAHHGKHGVEGGRSVVNEAHSDHPILRGVDSFFTKSDIYTISAVTDDNATVLLHGAVTESLDPGSEILDDQRNKPMQPLAWLREYTAPSGAKGMCFGTTAGASVDFEDAALRTLVVNAAHFLTAVDVPKDPNVDPIDPFETSMYGFHREPGFFKDRNLQVSDFALGHSAQTVVQPVEAAAD